MSIVRKLITVLTAFLLTAFPVYAASAGEEALAIDSAYCREASCREGTLLAQNVFEAGTSSDDWLAIAFAVSGQEESYSSYLKKLEDYVTECYESSGTLSKNKATEYHRIALTVKALGGDPLSFGKNGSEPVNLIADGIWNFGDIGKQGLNGRIYALIALDMGNYEIPSEAEMTRESLVKDILNAQEENGGFGLVSGGSDVDITAMALQALAPYAGQYPEQIEKALSYLSLMLTDNCGYISYGIESSESLSQVIIALSSLGIDPENDERFQKNGKNVLESLDSYRLTDGRYSHGPGEEANMIATEQALLAKAAVSAFRNEGRRLYAFTSLSVPKESSGGNRIPVIIIAAAVLMAAAGITVITVRRKHYVRKIDNSDPE